MKVKLRDCAQLIKTRVGMEKATYNNYVSTNNMLPNRGGIKFEDSNLPKSKTVNYYQKGDILISNIRPYFKKIWLADRDGTRSGDVLCFRSDDPKLLGKYLYCTLQSDHFFNYVVSTSKGTKMPRGDKEAILDYEFDLPTEKEQYKKYNPIIRIEEKIELNNQINDNLLELISLIWNKYSKDIKFKITLQQLAQNIITGKTPNTKIKENYGTDIPFVKIPDMHNKVFIDETMQSLSLLGANSQKSKYLPPNSIMVSCIGNPGLVSLTGTTVQTNQQINSLILKPKYLYCTFLELKSLKDKIGNLGSGGTTIKNLNKSDFSNLEITVPDRESILDKFNNIARPIFDQIHTNNIETKKLMQLKASLLNKYF